MTLCYVSDCLKIQDVLCGGYVGRFVFDLVYKNGQIYLNAIREVISLMSQLMHTHTHTHTHTNTHTHTIYIYIYFKKKH
jgi:hypothetical protein